MSAMAEIVETFGRIDVLLNAAGVGAAGSVHTVDEEEWDRVVDINLKGSFLTSKTRDSPDAFAAFWEHHSRGQCGRS